MILTYLNSDKNGIVFAKYDKDGEILRLSFIPTTELVNVPAGIRDFCKNVWTIEVVNSFRISGIK